ncbi:hypothetical protein ACFL5V_13310 [Fibrobacterota bacterium]
MKRWYDKYGELAKNLDSFKEMEPKQKDPLIKGIMELIKEHQPELLAAEKAFEFPLEIKRRRWYDKDPYLWLMINTLQGASRELLKLVSDYLTKNAGG